MTLRFLPSAKLKMLPLISRNVALTVAPLKQSHDYQAAKNRKYS